MMPRLLHRRTAIVNEKVITGCWMCRHHMQVHEKDEPVLNWCEATKINGEYMTLTNIHIVPKECIFGVKPE